MKTKTLLFIMVAGFSVGLVMFNPTYKASGQEVRIHYEKEAQVELLNPEGTRVLIDIYNPDALTSPATENDVLLTTHLHYDHVSGLLNSFPGKQLKAKTGTIELKDVSIKGIVASHSTIPPSKPGGGNNIIYIVDISGLRIVHFGDTEQKALTDEQLEALGDVDVAFMEFWIDRDDKYKYFDMMDQVKPRLIIPTHLGEGAAQYAAEKWPSFRWDEKSLTITPESLPKQTSFLFLGDRAKEFGKVLKLRKWRAK